MTSMRLAGLGVREYLMSPSAEGAASGRVCTRTDIARRAAEMLEVMFEVMIDWGGMGDDTTLVPLLEQAMEAARVWKES